MTDVLDRSVATDAPPVADAPDAGAERPGPPPSPHATAGPPPAAPLTPRRIAVMVVAWLLVTVAGIVLVLYQVGPLLEQRDQRDLLGRYRTEIRQAANEAYGLQGTETPTQAPDLGAPVAIVDIGDTGTRQVAVEGAAPQQTRRGPGHLVGSAGPGQPGNSVLIGRRNLFGGPFRTIGDLREGDRILVTTVQGPSVYEVGHVGRHRIVESSGAPATDPTSTGPAATEEPDEDAPLLPSGRLSTDQLYGPSTDDRLTLVTSASGSPTASDEALVVVAEMDGLPYAPTPQGGRTSSGDGRGGDPSATAPLALAALAYLGVLAATVAAYRRVPWRSAYLLSAPPLVALTIVLAEQVARLLPAWS